MLNLFRHPCPRKQVDDHPGPTRNRPPAKAGVHAGRRYAIRAPAFAGEQALA